MLYLLWTGQISTCRLKTKKWLTIEGKLEGWDRVFARTKKCQGSKVDEWPGHSSRNFQKFSQNSMENSDWLSNFPKFNSVFCANFTLDIKINKNIFIVYGVRVAKPPPPDAGEILRFSLIFASCPLNFSLKCGGPAPVPLGSKIPGWG